MDILAVAAFVLVAGMPLIVIAIMAIGETIRSHDLSTLHRLAREDEE